MTSYSVTTPTTTWSLLMTGRPLIRYCASRRAACCLVWFAVTVITLVVMTSSAFMPASPSSVFHSGQYFRAMIPSPYGITTRLFDGGVPKGGRDTLTLLQQSHLHLSCFPFGWGSRLERVDGDQCQLKVTDFAEQAVQSGLIDHLARKKRFPVRLGSHRQSA